MRCCAGDGGLLALWVALRGRLQTTSSGVRLSAEGRERRGKARVSVSGGDREGERERIAADVSKVV